MGRRIHKSKRHKKLKFVDPCYKGGSRQKIYHTNEPPKGEDDFQISHRELAFLERKKKLKFDLKKKKKQKERKDDFLSVQSSANDGRDETEHELLDRLQHAAQDALDDVEIETKYDIDLKDGDEIARYIGHPRVASERKKEKRKQYKEKELNKKKMKEEDTEKDLKIEHIAFGDIVTAPPVLTTKPRKAPENAKAGKRSLALKEVLSSKGTEKTKKEGPVAIKWKDMAPEKRRDAEYERSRAIQMYRMLKDKKKEAQS